MAHAPTALQVLPWSLFLRPRVCECLYRTEYTCMPVMKDAHIRLILHNCYFQLPEEQCPTVNVLALHKSKCEWDDLIVAVLTNGGQDLTPVLASEKSAIYTYHRTTMSESFDAYTEREEHSMQHLHTWELWHEEILDVDVGAWILFLECVEEPDNRVICVEIRTKSVLKRRMLSPPSLAIRYLVLQPDGDFCLDSLHFHRCALHYLAVKQPSNKRGRNVTMIYRDTWN